MKVEGCGNEESQGNSESRVFQQRPGSRPLPSATLSELEAAATWLLALKSSDLLNDSQLGKADLWEIPPLWNQR